VSAEVFRTPLQLEEPDLQAFDRQSGGYDVDAYFKAVAAHREKLAEWCRQNTANPRSKLVGETISWPVADGKAEYMVLSTTPLHLIHLNYVDGYEVTDIMLRGLRVTDIKQMVQQRQAMEKLFGQSKRAS
jgi:hypothetical protein